MRTQAFPALCGERSTRIAQPNATILFTDFAVSLAAWSGLQALNGYLLVSHTDDHESARSVDALTDASIIDSIKFAGSILFLSSVPKIRLACQYT